MVQKVEHGRVRSCLCYPCLAQAKSVVLNAFDLKAKAPSITFFNLDCSSVILNWGDVLFRKLAEGALRLLMLGTTPINIFEIPKKDLFCIRSEVLARIIES